LAGDIYLTPFIPLSFEGEGEIRKGGATAPLGHPIYDWFGFQGKSRRE
jgi:hypothetical protein